MSPATRLNRALRRALVATTGLIMTGLMTSWFLAGALVAPKRSVVGEPPRELHTIAFSVQSDSGAVISGWHTVPEVRNGVIVLLHGIRSSRRSMLERARMLHDAAYATVMIDLQAHGASSGEAITVGYLEQHDVRAAVEFARRAHPGEPIGVVGVSLGGAAALLASPLDIDALVLESVYPTIQDAIYNRVAARLGPLASIPTSLLLIQLQYRLGVPPADLQPIDHIGDIACPVYVVSGSEDPHTTKAETRAMFAAAPEPKHLWLVEGAAHVDLLRTDPVQYRQHILPFFDRYLRGRSLKVATRRAG